MGKNLEIERKYLLNGLPRIDYKYYIEQGYFTLTNAKGVKENVRLRREWRHRGKEDYHLTIKRGKGLVREEDETDIDYDVFYMFWPFVTKRVSKVRYIYQDDDINSWCIDHFKKPFNLPGVKSLVLCEIELRSRRQKVTIPKALAPFIVREVTDDPTYVNINLAV